MELCCHLRTHSSVPFLVGNQYNDYQRFWCYTIPQYGISVGQSPITGNTHRCPAVRREKSKSLLAAAFTAVVRRTRVLGPFALLLESTVGLPGTGESAQCAVIVGVVTDPVEVVVVLDRRVVRI